MRFMAIRESLMDIRELSMGTDGFSLDLMHFSKDMRDYMGGLRPKPPPLPHDNRGLL